MNRDGFCCTYCGDKEHTQHIHHKKYTGTNPWGALDDDLQTVCECCHSILEYVKKEYLFKTVLKINRIATKTNEVPVLSCYLLDKDNLLNVVVFSYFNNNCNYIISMSEKILKSFLKEFKTLR